MLCTIPPRGVLNPFAARRYAALAAAPVPAPRRNHRLLRDHFTRDRTRRMPSTACNPALVTRRELTQLRGRRALGVGFVALLAITLAAYPLNLRSGLRYVCSWFSLELQGGQVRYFGHRGPEAWQVIRKYRSPGWSMPAPSLPIRWRIQSLTSTTYREVFVPFWVLAVPCALGATWALWPRQKRIGKCACPTCGYELTRIPLAPATGASESETVRCPECGDDSPITT